MSSEILIFTKSLTVGTPSPKVTKNLILAHLRQLTLAHLWRLMDRLLFGEAMGFGLERSGSLKSIEGCA
jgi:hypothetical protein